MIRPGEDDGLEIVRLEKISQNRYLIAILDHNRGAWIEGEPRPLLYVIKFDQSIMGIIGESKVYGWLNLEKKKYNYDSFTTGKDIRDRESHPKSDLEAYAKKLIEQKKKQKQAGKATSLYSFSEPKTERVDEIKDLERKILRHQKLYYKGKPEISDSEFDALWDRLTELDPDNELLVEKIGKDDHEMFDKVKHIIPMGSQQKATTPEEIEKWCDKMDFDQYIVEPKCDGISIELQYNGGWLTRAVTRGDGVKGDIVTDNVVKMKGSLKKID